MLTRRLLCTTAARAPHDLVKPVLAPQFLDRALFSLWNVGYYVQDDVIGDDKVVSRMKTEVDRLYDEGFMEISKIADAELGHKECRGLFEKEIAPSDWHDAPQTIMYAHSVVESMAQHINQNLPTLGFTNSYASKASLFLGSVFNGQPKHVDNSGAEYDNRKITMVYFLNDGWSTEDGGIWKLDSLVETKFHGEEEVAKEIVVYPKKDRLLLFWSDLVEHEVQPCSRELSSITVWLTSDRRYVGRDINTQQIEERHIFNFSDE